MTWLELVRQDLRAAVRSVRRYRIAAVIAIVSLAAGIGAAAVTLTIRDVVFRNFPVLYREPAQLSQVQISPADRPIRAAGSPVPADLFTTWTTTPGLQIAGSMSSGARTVRTGDRTETVAVRAVTPNMFGLLGVAPIVGTGFSESTNGVMLSHRAWQRLFDGRGEVAGQALWIDGRLHIVTGVMPERFWLSDMISPGGTPRNPPRSRGTMRSRRSSVGRRGSRRPASTRSFASDSTSTRGVSPREAVDSTSASRASKARRWRGSCRSSCRTSWRPPCCSRS
jgi:hypothetical protein